MHNGYSFLSTPQEDAKALQTVDAFIASCQFIHKLQIAEFRSMVAQTKIIQDGLQHASGKAIAKRWLLMAKGAPRFLQLEIVNFSLVVAGASWGDKKVLSLMSPKELAWDKYCLNHPLRFAHGAVPWDRWTKFVSAVRTLEDLPNKREALWLKLNEYQADSQVSSLNQLEKHISNKIFSDPAMSTLERFERTITFHGKLQPTAIFVSIDWVERLNGLLANDIETWTSKLDTFFESDVLNLKNFKSLINDIQTAHVELAAVRALEEAQTKLNAIEAKRVEAREAQKSNPKTRLRAIFSILDRQRAPDEPG